MESDFIGRLFFDINSCGMRHDGLITDTFCEQEQVEDEILDLYKEFSDTRQNDTNLPLLFREKHINYLRKGLFKFYATFEALDCSQPWLCYWIVHGISLLDVKLTQQEKSQLCRFLADCQSIDGGFGGGAQQMPHLAASYAAINACVALESLEGLSLINREKLLDFVVSMKMNDGSFIMHRGGEADVRAVYCAVVVTKLTNLPAPNSLFNKTVEWILSCQTYEGGFGGSPGMEAHGGYTFCALAALILLGEEKKADLDRLLKWLSFKQLPLEGGFSGRTNKLVDGCYSFWQGASFALLSQCSLGDYVTEEGNWLFHQVALQEYILICCQHPNGGLVDKPFKPRDFYHTCYALSGLSIAQHSQGSKTVLGNSTNLLRPIVPVFNLTTQAVSKAQEYFYNLHSRTTETNKNTVTVLNKEEGLIEEL